MLSVAEVHNMGLLARGFCAESLHGRDTYGLETAALEAASGNVVLQQQLNDLISNSLLQQQQQQSSSSSFQQCSSSFINDSSSCLMVGDAYPGLFTSMGFSQSDIERTNFLLDDLPPVGDHHHGHPYAGPVSSSNNIVVQLPVTFSPINSLDTVGLSPPPQLLQPEAEWMDRKLISPRELKREASLDQTTLQLQPRKKLDKSARTVDTTTTMKNKRPATEQAGDHILRERQRRDDMAGKFAVLESLLPIGVKRDRSTIVDDSIEYVKNLHHRIKSLQERKEELNQTVAAAATATGSNQKTIIASRRGLIEVLQPRHGTSSPSELKELKAPVTRRLRVSEEELKGIHDVLRTCLEKMDVHADLPHQVVIEMVCKPQPRLQSNILLCMENLNLDVTQCSISKIAHRLICIITAKPQEGNTSGIVAALKNALQR